jgi:predicted HTH domain antitoxin
MATSGGSPSGNEAFSLVAGGSRQARAFLQAMVGVSDEEALKERSEELLELSPEERFAAAAELLPAAIDFNIEQLDSEGEEGDLPAWIGQLNPEQLESILVEALHLVTDQLQHLRDQLHQEVLERQSDAEGYLVVSLLLADLIDLVEFIVESPDAIASPDALQSLYGCLLLHFMLIESGEKQHLYPELIEDISRYPNYIARVQRGEAAAALQDRPFEQVERSVLVAAAVKLYQDEPISVARGAELAGVSRDDFERALTERGMQPRYGPDSVDELHSGRLKGLT